MPKSFLHQLPFGLHSTDICLSKGDFLFEQGTPVSKIYFIKSGQIKLIRHGTDGFSVILHTGKAGETIAEASLFSDYYHCSSIADVATQISFMKKQDVLQFLQNKPQEMMRLLAIFSQQIRDLRSLNEIKNIRSANERVLSYIISNIDNNKEMLLDVSLKDIAQKIGLAHETFYRTLKKLEQSGQIIRKKNAIKVLKITIK
jgi:CRP-like cAMP-binding protein